MTCSARGSYSCCGAVEIAGVSEFSAGDADNFFSDVEYTDDEGGETDQLHTYAAIIFTDNTRHEDVGGFELVRWIRSKRFGAVVSCRPAYNGNSGNKIKVWVWTPNAAGLKYLKEKHGS